MIDSGSREVAGKGGAVVFLEQWQQRVPRTGMRPRIKPALAKPARLVDRSLSVQFDAYWPEVASGCLVVERNAAQSLSDMPAQQLKRLLRRDHPYLGGGWASPYRDLHGTVGDD